MKKVVLKTHEIFTKFLPETIEKDIDERDQRICTECGGSGFSIIDLNFNNDIGEKEHPLKYFPYNNKSISFCNNCYFGVQRLCPFCKEPYKNKAYYSCECKGYLEEKASKDREKLKKKFLQAAKISLNKAKQLKMEMLYDELNNGYVKIENLDDIFDSEVDPKPSWLFGTKQECISLDVDFILEQATNDLHEDVIDNLIDVEDLQKYLIEWANKNRKASLTYYPDYSVVVYLEDLDKIQI